MEVLLEFERVLRFDTASSSFSKFLEGRLKRATMATVVQLKLSLGDNNDGANSGDKPSICKEIASILDQMSKLDRLLVTLSNRATTVKASIDSHKLLMEDQLEKVQKILTILVQFKTHTMSRLSSLDSTAGSSENGKGGKDFFGSFFPTPDEDQASPFAAPMPQGNGAPRMVYNAMDPKNKANNANDDDNPPQDLATLLKEMAAMKIRITTLEKGNRSDTVFLCGHVFKDDRDVSAWMILHLPTDKPFGSFVCIYSFLQ